MHILLYLCKLHIIPHRHHSDENMQEKHIYYRSDYNFLKLIVILNIFSAKGPSVRQLSSKSPELELPLLRQNGDEREDSPADDEDEEITLH